MWEDVPECVRGGIGECIGGGVWKCVWNFGISGGMGGPEGGVSGCGPVWIPEGVSDCKLFPADERKAVLWIPEGGASGCGPVLIPEDVPFGKREFAAAANGSRTAGRTVR